MISNSKTKFILAEIIDMSQFTYRIIILIGLLSFFYSCKDELNNSKGPTIKFTTGNQVVNNDTLIAPGQLMTFGIESFMGSENITEFYIRVINDSTQVYFDTGVNIPSLRWTGSFIKSFNPNERWEFVVRDRYSKSSSISIEIQADDNGGFNPIETFTDIVIGAQENPSIGPCLDTRLEQSYSLEDAFNNQALIDLVCYYYGEDENVIGSPGANIESGVFPENLTPINWSIRNTTRFIKLLMLEETFNQIQNDSALIANYLEGEGKRKAKNLVSGDVYSFKTQDNRIGILKINEVIGESNGQIYFDFKIQQYNK